MRLDDYGIDAVCDDIIAQKTMTAIAEEQGLSIGTFLNWVNGDAERSARVREARSYTARIWDEKAEEVIRDSGEEFDLKKAKELAHHYRWRASKIAPKEYGDRIQHANDPDSPLPAPQFIIQPVKPAGD